MLTALKSRILPQFASKQHSRKASGATTAGQEHKGVVIPGAFPNHHQGSNTQQNVSGPQPVGAHPTQLLPTLEHTIIKNRWKLISVLGKGAFGEVYYAMDLETHTPTAVKIESPLCKKPVLKLEISILKKLQGACHVSRFIGCGRFMAPKSHLPYLQSVKPTNEEFVYSYLVMELLGTNLSEFRKKMPDGKVCLSLTCILGEQMISSLQALHEIGILHRDVKPGNFCLTKESEERWKQRLEGEEPNGVDYTLYLIDFGLSRRYLSSSGSIREPRDKVGFRGTARYASIAAHLGKELGRVDDLWSVFYMLVEFLTGALPWKGKEKDVIGQMKQTMTNEDLVAGLPSQMLAFLTYLKRLEYASTPDYVYLRTLMNEMHGDVVDTDIEMSDAEDLDDKTECPNAPDDYSEETSTTRAKDYSPNSPIIHYMDQDEKDSLNIQHIGPPPPTCVSEEEYQSQPLPVELTGPNGEGVINSIHPPLFHFHQQLAGAEAHSFSHNRGPSDIHSNDIAYLAKKMGDNLLIPDQPSIENVVPETLEEDDLSKTPKPPKTPAPSLFSTFRTRRVKVVL